MDEKPMLETLREDVKDAVTLAEYKAGKPLFTEEIINDIGPVDKKEEENLLDQTLDIGENLIDENGEIDSVSFEELLDNDVDFKDSEENNIIEDDFISEKVEFNNNEFDSFYNDAKSSKIEHSEIINDNQKVK